MADEKELTGDQSPEVVGGPVNETPAPELGRTNSADELQPEPEPVNETLKEPVEKTEAEPAAEVDETLNRISGN